MGDEVDEQIELLAEEIGAAVYATVETMGTQNKKDIIKMFTHAVELAANGDDLDIITAEMKQQIEKIGILGE